MRTRGARGATAFHRTEKAAGRQQRAERIGLFCPLRTAVCQLRPVSTPANGGKPAGLRGLDRFSPRSGVSFAGSGTALPPPAVRCAPGGPLLVSIVAFPVVSLA